MEKLRKEVRAKKAVYTRSLTALDKLMTERRNEVEISLCVDSIKEKKASLNASHEKLLAAVSEEEFEAEIESFAELESLERASLNRAAQRLNQTRETIPNEPPPTVAVHSHLEKIEMPTFHGDPRRYPDFIAAFKVFVHGNDAMSAMEKMLRLKGKLRGPALEAVGGLGFTAAEYESALQILEQRFGGRDRLIQESLRGLRQLSAVSGGANGLREFADGVTSVTKQLQSMGDVDNIRSDTLFREVIAKLPAKERDAFFEESFAHAWPQNLLSLEPWLQRRAAVHCMSAEYADNGPHMKQQRQDKPTEQANNATMPKRTFANNRAVKCSSCREGCRALEDCAVFLENDVNSRWEIVKSGRHCFTCLRRGHRTADCYRSGRCTCGRAHHRLLCSQEGAGAAAGASQPSPPSQPRVTTTGGLHCYARRRVALRTLPVMVNLGGRQMLVNAFLDGGSDTSYIREDVAHALGATWHQESLQIATLGGAVINQPASEVVIDVGCPNDGKFIANIQAWTLPVICEDLEMVNWDAEKKKWSHLSEIDFQKPADSEVLDLLIGSDYPELHEVLERRSGPPQTPVAERTPLGWVCVGPVGAVAPPPARRPRVVARASAAVNEQDLLRRFWEVDELAKNKPESLTDQEKVAEEKASELLRYADSRYKIGIPWKDGRPCLPDNKTVALARLRSPEKTLSKDLKLKQKYQKKMEEHLKKGHVPGQQNSADDCFRGLHDSELTCDSRWIRGPQFLREPSEHWPQTPLAAPSPEAKEDEKKVAMPFPARNNQETVIRAEDFSSWKRLLAVTAWAQRFTRNCRQATDDRQRGPLAPAELRVAEQLWLKEAQKDGFREEWEYLARDQQVPPGSKIRDLQPYISEDKVLRVGGRLDKSDLPQDSKHPIILPRRHPGTTLTIKETHERNRHAGVNHVLADTRARFWIVNGREAVKAYDRGCLFCSRRRAKPAIQVMAPLPESRVRVPLRAFSHRGVNLFGTFYTRVGRRAMAKRYGCIFTCLSTRAVHLEMVSSLEADSFLLAFSRMAARRGGPVEVTSDNGTNFVRAERELAGLFQSAAQDKISGSMARSGIRWHWNPPQSPHHGGVFEALIKSATRAIRAIVGTAMLTDEELQTTIAGVESLLNTRPLTYTNSDSRDDSPLTPNHFIVGQLGGPLALELPDEEARCPRRRWRHVQEIVSRTWRRFPREMLPNLNRRSKWMDVQPATKKATSFWS